MPSLKYGGNYHENISLHSSEISEYDESSEQKQEGSDDDDKILFYSKNSNLTKSPEESDEVHCTCMCAIPLILVVFTMHKFI